jgi:two-component system, cell cycle response regulator
MHIDSQSCFLLASSDPPLLAHAEPALQAFGARVCVALTPDAALKAILDEPPSLALIDARLPGMEVGRFLASVRAESVSRNLPIVLFSDTVSEELKDRLAEGVVDDLVAPDAAPDWLRLRVELALRASSRGRELEQLREQSALDAEQDRMTGASNRSSLMRSLFRETDRAKRMNTALCVILFDIDDFGHWNARLGTVACDRLLAGVVERVARLLRSYDLLGRVGNDEFLVALPGCSAGNGASLAERMRAEVFAEPYSEAGRLVRLSACFAVVPSRGRSSLVILREAEDILRLAKADGPDSIQCAGVRHGMVLDDINQPDWRQSSCPPATLGG